MIVVASSVLPGRTVPRILGPVFRAAVRSRGPADHGRRALPALRASGVHEDADRLEHPQRTAAQRLATNAPVAHAHAPVANAHALAANAHAPAANAHRLAANAHAMAANPQALAATAHALAAHATRVLRLDSAELGHTIAEVVASRSDGGLSES